jgi:hypothetical protein
MDILSLWHVRDGRAPKRRVACGPVKYLIETNSHDVPNIVDSIARLIRGD